MKPIALIIGQRQDHHVQAVAAALREMGGTPLILDHMEPSGVPRLNYLIGEDHLSGAVYIDDIWIDLSEVCAVWWRVKLMSQVDLIGQIPTLVTDFALREWRSMLDSLEFFTPKARWVNPRAADQTARHKPIQLCTALSLGFAIPNTVVSNDAEIISYFLDSSCEEHIYKVLTWYHEPPDKMIFTSLVDSVTVRSDPQAVAMAPGIFQTRIHKKYEVRATVIGDRVFAVRVDSQDLETTQLDWRHNQFEVPYSYLELPTDIEKSLVAMNRRFGLVFGAYDLIITPEDQTIFLEVNPLGQWLWLERITNLPITYALAEYLLEPR